MPDTSKVRTEEDHHDNHGEWGPYRQENAEDHAQHPGDERGFPQVDRLCHQCSEAGGQDCRLGWRRGKYLDNLGARAPGEAGVTAQSLYPAARVVLWGGGAQRHPR